MNFTDQGARTIKDSPDRFEAFKMAALGSIRTQTLRGFSISEMRELRSALK